MAPRLQRLAFHVAAALAAARSVAAAPCAPGACPAEGAEVALEAAVDEVELLQVRRTSGEQSGSAEEPRSEEQKPKCKKCPPKGFDTQGALQGGFDLDWYISKTWYVQQQMVVQYLPAENFYCVTADYKKIDNPTFMGYDIEVQNRAQNANGEIFGNSSTGSTLGAKIVDGKAGKLKVAPTFLPSLFAGPYWVVAFSIKDGWALVSGGPPKMKGEDGCKTGSGTNNSGLWIFSRSRQAPPSDLAAARAAAEAKGFDLSVLKDVDQSNCDA